MKVHLNRMLALVLLAGCLFTGVAARAEAIDRYLGVWVGEGIAAEIWKGPDGGLCRIVFSDGGDESVVWSYNGCWVDKQEDCLTCATLTREWYRYDALWDMLEETDWALDDFAFAKFEETKDGLLFSDDGDRLDRSYALTKLEKAGTGERNAALAFVGEWQAESATLRVEDRGVAYMFTITVPLDADRDARWTYTCLYDAAESRMVSKDVSYRRIITHMPDGSTVEEEVDRDYSSAVFTLEDANRLLWSDVTDGDGGEMTLERVGN